MHRETTPNSQITRRELGECLMEQTRALEKQMKLETIANIIEQATRISTLTNKISNAILEVAQTVQNNTSDTNTEKDFKSISEDSDSEDDYLIIDFPSTKEEEKIEEAKINVIKIQELTVNKAEEAETKAKEAETKAGGIRRVIKVTKITETKKVNKATNTEDIYLTEEEELEIKIKDKEEEIEEVTIYKDNEEITTITYTSKDLLEEAESTLSIAKKLSEETLFLAINGITEAIKIVPTQSIQESIDTITNIEETNLPPELKAYITGCKVALEKETPEEYRDLKKALKKSPNYKTKIGNIEKTKEKEALHQAFLNAIIATIKKYEEKEYSERAIILAGAEVAGYMILSESATAATKATEVASIAAIKAEEERVKAVTKKSEATIAATAARAAREVAGEATITATTIAATTIAATAAREAIVARATAEARTATAGAAETIAATAAREAEKSEKAAEKSEIIKIAAQTTKRIIERATNIKEANPINLDDLPEITGD